MSSSSFTCFLLIRFGRRHVPLTHCHHRLMFADSAIARSHRPLKLIFGNNQRKPGNGPPKVLGLAGATCSGKTSLAKALQNELIGNGLSVELIGQDQFYKPKEEVRTVKNAEEPDITFYDYDEIQSVNETKMDSEIQRARANPGLDVVIVEGNMITELETVRNHLDWSVFITVGKERCRERRDKRIYDPPDEKGYFDQIVWPAYERLLQRARAFSPELLAKMSFIDSDNIIPLDELIVEFQHLICDQIHLSRDSSLCPDDALDWVSSPACGANSLFTGTTRDTFNGKRVLRLDYECYEPMARAEMAKLCGEVRKRTEGTHILHIYMAHRIGSVPIREVSVAIAASSPQRRAALEGTQWLIDQLKSRVPIWKKEVYEDGTCSWKENAEQPGERKQEGPEI